MKTIIKLIDKKLLFNFLSSIYKRYLFYKTEKFLANYPYLSIFTKNNKQNPLIDLFHKYGTDKGELNENSHFYGFYYNEIFKNKKSEIKLIFECGIGTTDTNIHSNMGENGSPGASLRSYRDYFENAQIYGADIDKKILFLSERISTHHVDQLDTKSIKKMWNDINLDGFDLIIDDGMHDLNANYNFFINSFSKLKKNGLYIIEDVHTAYLIDIVKKLEKFKPKIICSKIKNNIDDYLIIIKKF